MTRPATDGEITLRGLRFHYREWPREGAPVVVLLHGITSQAGAWADLADGLASHRLLAPDQRGHGRTSWAEDYALERFVEDLGGLVDGLGLARFGLMGHSLGGRVAYLYAARAPSRVERLIVSDIGPDPFDLTLVTSKRKQIERVRPGPFDLTLVTPKRRQIERVRPEPVGRAQVPPRLDFADFDDAFSFVRSFRPDQPEPTARRLLADNLTHRADGRVAFRFDPALLHERARHDPAVHWQALSRISAPTLILRGGNSSVLPRAVAERMAHVIPRASLVEVPGAGHGLWYEAPEAYAAAVARFLSAA